MQNKNLQNIDNKLQEKSERIQFEDVKQPVVNEQRNQSGKGIWGLFSQFVMIGGDLV